VCFTYGTWFGATALACRGHTAASDAALRKACGFLVGKQRLDGGWGESYLSCQDKVCGSIRSVIVFLLVKSVHSLRSCTTPQYYVVVVVVAVHSWSCCAVGNANGGCISAAQGVLGLGGQAAAGWRMAEELPVVPGQGALDVCKGRGVYCYIVMSVYVPGMLCCATLS
jgi:hypothetical protein